MITLALCAILLCWEVSFTSGQFGFGTPTCLGKCGSKPKIPFQGQCSCAKSCEKDNNCCRGYWNYCTDSCRNKCGNGYHPLYKCQCYDGCSGDKCCKDYQRVCVDAAFQRSFSSAPPPTTTRATTTTTPRPIEIGYSFIAGQVIECEKGIPFVICPENPCNRPCERHPDAHCLVNQCGTCEAKYSDLAGNEVECYDPESYCSDGQRIFDCGGTDLCAGTSCPAFPRAICVPNKCGGCYYDFVDEKGNMVDCELRDTAMQSSCGEGLKPVSCFPLPCVGQTCAADITAKCKDVVCGECRAEFYDIQGNLVNCSMTDPVICDDECEEDPCESVKCDAHPNAECLPRKTTECGKCEASFTDNGRQLKDINCVVPDECIAQSSCKQDTCKMYTCPGKDVICIAQYCNGCNALFFDVTGNRLLQDQCYNISTLNLRECPDGKQPEICSADLCLGQRCGEDFSPICKPDECNNCELLFYDEEGEEIDCDEEIPTEEEEKEDDVELCDNGNIQMSCDNSNCKTAECFDNPDAICAEDPCDACKPRFFDISLTEIACDSTPDTAVDASSQSLCPDGKHLRKCDQNACDSFVCENNSTSICKPNPCNDCKPMFFDQNGKRVKCNYTSMRTCEGKCGEIRGAAKPCYCDYECMNRGDCCSDFRTKCETCLGRCGKFIPSANCQCTSDCRMNKNCCGDFTSVCLPSKSCKGLCGTPLVAGDICQCNLRCVERANCCLDFADMCV